jgi:molybdopterin-biosynthesis enzyme MoeA-like protein
MADIPRNSLLIPNPVNKMPGFQLDNRFFFVPGFPQMAHPMIRDMLDQYYPQSDKKYSCSFIAHTSEARMIDIMEALSDEVELSCLPVFAGEKRSAEIYLSCLDKELLESQCNFFKAKLDEMDILYSVVKK